MLCRTGVGEALFGNEQVFVVDRTTQLKHGGPCSSHCPMLSANPISQRFPSEATNLDVSLLAVPTSFSRLRVTDPFLHCCLDIVDPMESGNLNATSRKRTMCSSCGRPPAGEHGCRYGGRRRWLGAPSPSCATWPSCDQRLSPPTSQCIAKRDDDYVMEYLAGHVPR